MYITLNIVLHVYARCNSNTSPSQTYKLIIILCDIYILKTIHSPTETNFYVYV